MDKVEELLNRVRYLQSVTELDKIQNLWLGNTRHPAVKVGLLVGNTRLVYPRIERRVVMLRARRENRTGKKGV